MRIHLLIILLLLAGQASRATEDGSSPTTISAERLAGHVQVLASDAFAGRAPGGPGEEKTVNYLVEQFKALGLSPGGRNGSWTQAVSLWHTRVAAPLRLTVHGGANEPLELNQGTDVAVETTRPQRRISLDEVPLVFVGFGAHAPERDWDDFGNIDLTGKIAVFLVNDPDFSAAEHEPVAGLFGGRRMTYYGRWAYKFEEAQRRGALGALVIHEDVAAGYGWSVAASAPGDNFSLVAPGGAAQRMALQGWLHRDAAVALFARAGLDFARQRELARKSAFTAFPLGDLRLSGDMDIDIDRVESRNVLARLPGTAHADETIMVTSHWDGYGIGEPDAKGRTVRPGANDDALGTAGIIEIARALKQAPPLERSVVFAAWTAEESGLLGSASYAADPLYPVETTVANFTLDILQTAGPARDVILIGEGQSELQEDLARAAAAQGRYVTPENLPENGLFYRADHFSMARVGIPVLLIMGIAGGADLVEGGRKAGDAWIADYVGNCYHQTCDAWSADWDLRGAVQDVELIHAIVRDLGNSRRWPAWYEGSEFKAVRDASRARR
jgi:Zn-dependent M28 family amino/carboxypeptidase